MSLFFQGLQLSPEGSHCVAERSSSRTLSQDRESYLASVCLLFLFYNVEKVNGDVCKILT